MSVSRSPSSDPDARYSGIEERDGWTGWDAARQPAAEAMPAASLPKAPPSAPADALVSLGPPALQETLFQCPFCQSVFRSTVAAQLGKCPVCASISPGQASPGPRTEPHPPRWKRTGTEHEVKLCRPKEEATHGDSAETPNDAPPVRRRRSSCIRAQAASRRRQRLLRLGTVLVCGVLCAWFGKRVHALASESARIQRETAAGLQRQAQRQAAEGAAQAPAPQRPATAASPNIAQGEPHGTGSH